MEAPPPSSPPAAAGAAEEEASPPGAPSPSLPPPQKATADDEGKLEDDNQAKEAPPPPSPAIRQGTAIIVPYRDLHSEQERAAHLKRFLEEMPRLLQGHPFHIYLIEQSDDGRKFNRGKLLNIGFQLATTGAPVCSDDEKKEGKDDEQQSLPPPPPHQHHHHQVFIFHDVDLLPSKELVPHYVEQPTQPVHIARVWQRYSGNPKYIGGAVAFSEADFKRINGFPNTFWGWGGEDDEMRKRIDEEKLEVTFPKDGSMEDMEAQSLDEKLQTLRAHRDWKCNVKWEVLNEHAETWRRNGLADLDYSLLETEALGPHATKYTVDVKLNGHWTDTVHEIANDQHSNNNNKNNRHRGGGRGRGGGGGDRRPWKGGGGQSDYRRRDDNRERDRDRDRDSYKKRRV